MTNQPTYDRLLEAASKLRGWRTAADVSRGLTQAGFPVSTGQVSNWKSRGVSREAQMQGARIIGCDINWLATGEGSMAVSPNAVLPMAYTPVPTPEPKPIAPNVTPNIGGFRAIPLISSVSAGKFCAAVDLFNPGDAEEWVMFAAAGGPHTYALRVIGDSMTSPIPQERSYPSGSVVIVDPDKPVFNGSKVIAKIPGDDEVTFKVFKKDAGRRYLVPLNSQYPVIEMSEDMIICGVVIGGFWKE
jgi:SOS-response transcriptional repressor LexA